jgi:hypothetical protein
MKQLDISEEKLFAKRGHGMIFSDDGDTTSPSSEPRTLESRQRSDKDSSDEDDNDEDDFLMYINPEVLSNSSSLCNICNS